MRPLLPATHACHREVDSGEFYVLFRIACAGRVAVARAALDSPFDSPCGVKLLPRFDA